MNEKQFVLSVAALLRPGKAQRRRLEAAAQRFSARHRLWERAAERIAGWYEGRTGLKPPTKSSGQIDWEELFEKIQLLLQQIIDALPVLLQLILAVLAIFGA